MGNSPAIRYGLKFGLAGTAVVFISLWARLEMPGWALFTVFVLMTAQYVGAVAEKSVFRLIGTVAGGLIGYLITGALEQNPVVFLVLLGLVIGTCTALFGQSRYPYAFLLCGMTALVVASNGMRHPENSWTFLLTRIEEIGVGILVTMVVQGVLWPRYARLEFHEHLRACFGDLRSCFADTSPICAPGETQRGASRAQEFAARITGLRTLLTFGARESFFFRQRLGTYFELTVCLGKMACAIGTLRKGIPPESPLLVHAGEAFGDLRRALESALDDLSGRSSTGASRAFHRTQVAAAFEVLDARFLEMRDKQVTRLLPPDQALVVGLHVAAFDDIRAQIVKTQELMDSLPKNPLQREFHPAPMLSPRPPLFWIRTGIKSGLVVILAFLIDNWLHPPGGTMFILGAWVFTAMNAASPGGQGDRRAFHLVPLCVSVVGAVSLLLLAAAPMLSSYAVMNTLLFVWLFVWGFLSFTTRGMTIPMQLGMLMLVGILGLNAQHPVSFQAVVEFFFGLVLALLLAALVQRLIWPSLPQREIRDRFVEALRLCRKILRRETRPLWEETRLALIPDEVQVRLKHLEPPICPPEEPGRLKALALSIAGLGAGFVITLDRLPSDLPSDIRQSGQEKTKALDRFFEARLEAIERGFQLESPVTFDDKEIQDALASWRTWTQQARLVLLESSFHPLGLARFTGFAERYQLLGEEILSAGRAFARLRLPLYMGDFSL